MHLCIYSIPQLLVLDTTYPIEFKSVKRVELYLCNGEAHVSNDSRLCMVGKSKL